MLALCATPLDIEYRRMFSLAVMLCKIQPTVENHLRNILLHFENPYAIMKIEIPKGGAYVRKTVESECDWGKYPQMP